MSFLEQFDQIWKLFIRPQRQQYSFYDLGPILIESKGVKAKRSDFELINQRNLILKCSIYEPEIDASEPRSCIIYLHCFNGSRIESVRYAEQIISERISFVCFDFSASGLSAGEYVSLGWYESQDVQVVVDYLRKIKKINCISLWGRSMGAVTALLYAQRDPNIKTLTIDSPFANMNKLAIEISKKKTKFPGFIIKGVMAFVKQTIKQKAQFNLDDIDVMKCIDKCNMPAFFIASKQDNLINSKHTDRIFEKYPGNKQVVFVEGDHNEARKQEIINQIINFNVSYLKNRLDLCVQVSHSPGKLTSAQISQSGISVTNLNQTKRDTEIEREQPKVLINHNGQNDQYYQQQQQIIQQEFTIRQSNSVSPVRNQNQQKQQGIKLSIQKSVEIRKKFNRNDDNYSEQSSLPMISEADLKSQPDQKKPNCDTLGCTQSSSLQQLPFEQEKHDQEINNKITVNQEYQMLNQNLPQSQYGGSINQSTMLRQQILFQQQKQNPQQPQISNGQALQQKLNQQNKSVQLVLQSQVGQPPLQQNATNKQFINQLINQQQKNQIFNQQIPKQQQNQIQQQLQHTMQQQSLNKQSQIQQPKQANQQQPIQQQQQQKLPHTQHQQQQNSLSQTKLQVSSQQTIPQSNKPLPGKQNQNNYMVQQFSINLTQNALQSGQEGKAVKKGQHSRSNTFDYQNIGIENRQNSINADDCATLEVEPIQNVGLHSPISKNQKSINDQPKYYPNSLQIIEAINQQGSDPDPFSKLKAEDTANNYSGRVIQMQSTQLPTQFHSQNEQQLSKDKFSSDSTNYTSTNSNYQQRSISKDRKTSPTLDYNVNSDLQQQDNMLRTLKEPTAPSLNSIKDFSIQLQDYKIKENNQYEMNYFNQFQPFNKEIKQINPLQKINQEEQNQHYKMQGKPNLISYKELKTNIQSSDKQQYYQHYSDMNIQLTSNQTENSKIQEPQFISVPQVDANQQIQQQQQSLDNQLSDRNRALSQNGEQNDLLQKLTLKSPQIQQQQTQQMQPPLVITFFKQAEDKLKPSQYSQQQQISSQQQQQNAPNQKPFMQFQQEQSNIKIDSLNSDRGLSQCDLFNKQYQFYFQSSDNALYQDQAQQKGFASQIKQTKKEYINIQNQLVQQVPQIEQQQQKGKDYALMRTGNQSQSNIPQPTSNSNLQHLQNSQQQPFRGIQQTNSYDNLQTQKSTFNYQTTIKKFAFKNKLPPQKNEQQQLIMIPTKAVKQVAINLMEKDGLKTVKE